MRVNISMYFCTLQLHLDSKCMCLLVVTKLGLLVTVLKLLMLFGLLLYILLNYLG
jgi:hypothetical protein